MCRPCPRNYVEVRAGLGPKAWPVQGTNAHIGNFYMAENAAVRCHCRRRVSDTLATVLVVKLNRKVAHVKRLGGQQYGVGGFD